MRAVVLVGGFGTRLRPLTLTTPKPMLLVGHRSIVENLVRMLARAGVEEVVLGLGFRPEPFMEAFPDGTCAGVHLHYAVEPEPLDTAGAIRFAADHAGIQETFIVVNGDIITDLDVAELVAYHRATGAEGTIHLTPVEDPSAYGVVAINSDGRVERFVEKPAAGTAPSNLINAGTYVFEPELLQRIPTGRKVSIEREIFPAVVADGGLYAWATTDYWIDTGRPETYRQANLDLINGRRSFSVPMVDAQAIVDPSAEVRQSIVSSGARVDAQARLIDSVILPGAIVGIGAEVRESIVMGVIGANAVVVDSVVGAEGVVRDGATLEHERVPAPPYE